MTDDLFTVGIDMAKDTFAAAFYGGPARTAQVRDGFENSPEGFADFIEWLNTCQVPIGQTLICIEATGVYSEAICYYLHRMNIPLWLETPQKVKQAFKIKDHKTDAVDAMHIAEYAYRFRDRYRPWQPKSQIIEHLGTLLSCREQLVQQRTATTNALQAFRRKQVQTPKVIRIYEQNLLRLSKQVQAVEEEMTRLIHSDGHYYHIYCLLHSVPGIADMGAANLLVLTNAGQELTEYPKLAAFLGLCPYQHTSGSSVRKRAKSAKLGPKRLRKILYMAAKSLVGRSRYKQFRGYFLKKQQEGKPDRLIYNNIANKLLRIICAVLREQRPYDPGYVSLKPNFNFGA